MFSSTCFFITAFCLCNFTLKAFATTLGRNAKNVLLSYHEYNSHAVYEPCLCRKQGTFSFLFNTHKSNAFLAYQDDGYFNNFDFFLINGEIRASVLFDECGVISKKLVIKGNFSDSRWHQVQLTREGTKLNLTVDGCHSQTILCSLPPSKAQKWNALYVGSIPLNIGLSSLAKRSIFRQALLAGFQGCIGAVTHSALGKSPEPLQLRSKSKTGHSCERCCLFGGKSDNHTDGVTGSKKGCECPEDETEKHASRHHNLTHAQTSLLTGFNKSDAISKVTSSLISSIQRPVLPTATSLVNTAEKSSSDLAQEYLEYAPISIIKYSTSSRHHGFVVVSSSPIFSMLPTPSQSSPTDVFSCSVHNKDVIMAKKSSACILRSSYMWLCLGLFVTVQSGCFFLNV